MKKIFAAALFCTALGLVSGAARAMDDMQSPGDSLPPPGAAAEMPASAPPANADLPPGADYPLEVAGAYAFATAPTQKNGAAFMALQNTGKVDAVLTGASSPVAEKVELHTMSMENGVMQMRPVDQFVIPAGGTLVMAPQSHHIMLIGLKSPLKTGDSFSIQLNFSNYPPMDTTFKVSAPGEAMPMDGHKMEGHEMPDHHMMMHDHMMMKGEEGCGMMKGMRCPVPEEEKAQDGSESAPAQE